MLPRLAEHDDVDDLLCVSAQGNDISTWFPKPPTAEYCACNPFTICHLAHLPDRKMAECLRRFLPDIMFLPGGQYIRFNGVPVVTMIQNMEPLMPSMKGDPPREVLKKIIQRKLTNSSVRRAEHTIAISGFVKDYLTGTLHVPENKVSQVYHGLIPQPDGNRMRPRSVPVGWRIRIGSMPALTWLRWMPSAVNCSPSTRKPFPIFFCRIRAVWGISI